MLYVIPLAALLGIFVASLIRGETIRRRTGDHAWAFAAARGRQRFAGVAFGVSTAVLAIAAAIVAWTGSGALAVFAAGLSTVGAAIVIVAQIQMGRAWRVGVRQGDAPLFVRHGLFRFSRNPIFVGMILIGLGVAVASGAWWAWLAWVAFVLACSAQVSVEEAHLSQSFGAEYQAFRTAVPRWIGIGG